MCPPLIMAGIGIAIEAASAASAATLMAAGSIAVTAASAGMSYMQQSSMADKQQAATMNNYNQQMETYKVQQGQEQKQATDEMSTRARQSMIESSRLRAVSGESGLAGNSIDRVQNESEFNAGTDITSIENNRMATQTQLHQNAMGIRAGSQTQMAQIHHPSLIGTGLQIAGGALDTATNLQTVKAFRGQLLPPMVTPRYSSGVTESS